MCSVHQTLDDHVQTFDSYSLSFDDECFTTLNYVKH